MRYSIWNMNTATDLGTYEAESQDAALDLMARDAGYQDYDDVCALSGVNRDAAQGELLITETA